ncbi:MAG: hypothetical protein HQL76_17110 [Magnetococcales bacterium]|nr:hypothetical protein [Magnetococcales bacterium]
MFEFQETEMTFDARMEEKRHFWLALANRHPPEWFATYVAAPGAGCAVVTRHGVENEPCCAWLERMEDVPFWAFALAKSYLDDVGEWPLTGMAVEMALLAYEQHQNPEMAVNEIITALRSVWNEVEVVRMGMGRD